MFDSRTSLGDLCCLMLVFRHGQTQSAATSLRCLRVSEQVIVILIRQTFARGMNISDNGIVPKRGCVHWETSINSKGVTSFPWYFPFRKVGAGGTAIAEYADLI
ncbi:MAG: hypothetical protein A2040_06580 [Rhodocyclales bacterium GWA2_65_19]|nr:MAG: hypothetical protein A2040_06580 [Rhodocyclales bacterium GWA2_65_19]